MIVTGFLKIVLLRCYTNRAEIMEAAACIQLEPTVDGFAPKSFAVNLVIACALHHEH